jgi:hypothetical protein
VTQNVFLMLRKRDDAKDASRLVGDVLARPSSLPAAKITLNTVVNDLPGLCLPHPEIPAATRTLDYILELGPDPDVSANALWDAAAHLLDGIGIDIVGGVIADEIAQVQYNRYWRDGEMSPGPKVVWLARKRDDVSHDYFVKRWRQHALMVWRVHVGIWRYAQNVVAQDVLGNFAEVEGVAITHYRSVEDFLTRQYPDDAARQEVIEDVTAFTAGAEAYVTREHILRSPTPEPQPLH